MALAKEFFGDMVKLVVDIEREILVAGGGLHSDGEEMLLDDGSQQRDLWGVNYYPEHAPSKRIEYVSLINQHHPANKRSQEILDPQVRERVKTIIARYFGDA